MVLHSAFLSPNGAVRRVSGRVCRYRDADMALRWTAAGYLQAEEENVAQEQKAK